MLPALNFQPLSSGDLTRNIFVFVLGFIMIFAGLYLAKKLQVIGGTMMSKEDRELLERAKRVLGMRQN